MLNVNLLLLIFLVDDSLVVGSSLATGTPLSSYSATSLQGGEFGINVNIFIFTLKELLIVLDLARAKVPFAWTLIALRQRQKVQLRVLRL